MSFFGPAKHQTLFAGTGGSGITAPSQTSIAKAPISQASLTSKIDQSTSTSANTTDDVHVAALPAEPNTPIDPMATQDASLGIKADIQKPANQELLCPPRTGLGAKEGRDLINAAIMALFDFKNDQLICASMTPRARKLLQRLWRKQP